jgi:microcystin-dependent protein
VAEPIGKIYETAVPSLSDTANIQEALRVYHYGKPSGLDVNTQYNPQNETLSILPEKSIAFYLNSFQSQINAVTLSIRPEFYAKKGNIVSADFDGARVLELSPDIGVTAPNGLLLTSDDSTPTGLKWQAPDITLTNIQTIANKIFANSTIATGGLKFLESGSLPNFTTTLRSPDQSSNKTVIFPTTDAELPGSSTTLVGTDTIQTLTNKTLTSPAISGGTLSTSSVDGGGAVVGTTASQTLTNKTISLEAESNTITGRLASTSGGTPAGVISQYAGTTAPAGYLLCQGQSVSTTTFADLFAAIGYNYGGSGGSFTLPNLQNRVPVGRGTGTFGSLNATGGEETVALTTANMAAHTHSGRTAAETQEHTHSGTTGTQSADHSHSGTSATGVGTHSHSIPEQENHTHSYYRGNQVLVASNGTAIGVQSRTATAAIGNLSSTVGAGFHNHGGSTGTASANHTHTVTTGGVSANHTHDITTGGRSATHDHTFSTDNGTGSGTAHNNLQPYIVVNYIIKT